MSGEKRRTVTVEEQELRRLREQESRLRSIQNDLPERLNAIREQARREFQQQMAPLEQRTRKHEQDAAQLRSNLRDLEVHSQQRLQQQQQQFQTELRQSEARQQQAWQKESANLRKAMEQGLKEERAERLQAQKQQRQEYLGLHQQLDQKFTQAVNTERQERIQGQQILQQQIQNLSDSIESEKQRKADISQSLLTDVEKIWQQIDQDYQHQRFAPGKLADLRRGLETAKMNLQQGISEAAIATTQETYFKLVDLRVELAQKEHEWLLFYNATWADLQNLLAEVRANRKCEIEYGQGQESDKFELEVDYWVNGRLSQYEQQLNQLEKQIKDGKKTLTIEQVKALGDEVIALQPVLGDILEQAQLAILNSQKRAEIADSIAMALESFGYRLTDEEDAIYESNDERNNYVIKLKNRRGDEVVSVISPSPDFGQYELSVNHFSQTADEDVHRANTKAIEDSLKANGIITDNDQWECKEQPKQEYRNLVQVKQRQTSPPPPPVTH